MIAPYNLDTLLSLAFLGILVYQPSVYQATQALGNTYSVVS